MLTTGMVLTEGGPSKYVMIGQVVLGAVLGFLLAWLVLGCATPKVGPFYAADKAHPYCNGPQDCRGPNFRCDFPHAGSRAICVPGEDELVAYPDTSGAP